MVEQMHIWGKYKCVIVKKEIDCNSCGGFGKKIRYTANPNGYSPSSDSTYPPRGYQTELSSHASGAVQIVNTSEYNEDYKSKFHTPILNSVQVPKVGTVQVPSGYCASYKDSSWSSPDQRWSTFIMYATITGDCISCNGTGKLQDFSHYTQGTYLSTVTAPINTYPQNGRHTDGYWYVHQGLANKTPTISGSNTNLGTVTSVGLTYSVDDEDGSDTLTCVEKLDGITLRAYNPARNTSYKVALPPWVEILNGTHTITITVTDQVGASATRTVTFAKAEHELEFTLAEPLPADAQITKAIMSITRAVPLEAELIVEVCNNAYDDAPTWENITSKALAGKKFYFSNATKTAEKWGYNLRVTLNRNETTGACYINSVGGCFE